MKGPSLDIVVIGLSLSSSWGNGHATTFRSLLRGLDALGHSVLFLERDVPWYADSRDLPDPDFCVLRYYDGIADMTSRFARAIRDADAVIVGSYVPQGVKVIDVDDEVNAKKAGIKEDDLITEIDGKAVNSADEVARIVRDSREKNSMMFKINRGGKTQNIEVKIPRKLKTADL